MSLLLLQSMLFANAFQNGKVKKKRKRNRHNVTKTSLKMCRICNNERGIIPIFNNIMHPNIPQDVQSISGVTLTEMDGISKHMCQNCLDLLDGCIIFREMCRRTNKIIAVTVKEEYKSENEKNDDKDKLGESDDCFNVPSPAFSEDNSQLWSCSTCDKEFYDMPSYNSHLANCNAQRSEVTKTPEIPEVTKKKFLCDICGKTAYSNASLLVHMGIHDNVFPFKCEQCPYQGRTMDLLKIHRRSHLVDKPFKCTQCPKATTTSSNLAKHMRHVHSTTRPYKCTYCDKAFSYQHDMKTHIRDIHLRQGAVDCDICYKKFNTKKILQGHRWKIHKIKGERQGRLPSYLQWQERQDKSQLNVLNT